MGISLKVRINPTKMSSFAKCIVYNNIYLRFHVYDFRPAIKIIKTHKLRLRSYKKKHLDMTNKSKIIGEQYGSFCLVLFLYQNYALILLYGI